MPSDQHDVSWTARLKKWVEESYHCYGGKLYVGSVPLYGLMRDILSNINFKSDYAAFLRDLGEKGTVIYALKYKSHLNTLTLYDLALRQGIPRPTFAFDLNMILWQPLSKAAGVIFAFLKRLATERLDAGSKKLQGLQEEIEAGHHTVIHLGGSEFFENKAVDEALTYIVDQASAAGKPVYIVPMLIAYGRRREKEKESAVNILFGQTENTGPLRRLITFIRYAGKIIVIPTEPTDVKAYALQYGHLTREDLVRQMRSDLIERIDVERTALLGPVLKSREEIISMVLKDEKLLDYVERKRQRERKTKKP